MARKSCKHDRRFPFPFFFSFQLFFIPFHGWQVIWRPSKARRSARALAEAWKNFNGTSRRLSADREIVKRFSFFSKGSRYRSSQRVTHFLKLLVRNSLILCISFPLVSWLVSRLPPIGKPQLKPFEIKLDYRFRLVRSVQPVFLICLPSENLRFTDSLIIPFDYRTLQHFRNLKYFTVERS